MFFFCLFVFYEICLYFCKWTFTANNTFYCVRWQPDWSNFPMVWYYWKNYWCKGYIMFKRKVLISMSWAGMCLLLERGNSWCESQYTPEEECRRVSDVATLCMHKGLTQVFRWEHNFFISSLEWDGATKFEVLSVIGKDVPRESVSFFIVKRLNLDKFDSVWTACIFFILFFCFVLVFWFLFFQL